jgi:hypothetical protein
MDALDSVDSVEGLCQNLVKWRGINRTRVIMSYLREPLPHEIS